MQKMKSNKGFTLIEMLIVVAIIGILVAVSIPMVNSSLEKARIATDLANERAAKAAALVIYLGNDVDTSNTTDKAIYDALTADTGKGCAYDAAAGKLLSTSALDLKKAYGKCKNHLNDYIQVSVTKATGDVTVKWATGGDNAHLKATT